MTRLLLILLLTLSSCVAVSSNDTGGPEQSTAYLPGEDPSLPDVNHRIEYVFLYQDRIVSSATPKTDDKDVLYVITLEYDLDPTALPRKVTLLLLTPKGWINYSFEFGIVDQLSVMSDQRWVPKPEPIDPDNEDEF